MTYEEQLSHHRWIEKRDSIIARDWKMCQVCMTSKNLEVHHKYYVKGKMAWEYPDDALITLCRTHHAEIHLERDIPVRDEPDRLSELFQSLRDNVQCLYIAISKQKNG